MLFSGGGDAVGEGKQQQKNKTKKKHTFPDYMEYQLCLENFVRFQ